MPEIRLLAASRAELRLREATSWLAALPPGDEVLVIGGTAGAAGELVRTVVTARGSAFGLHRLTLGRLAAELAKLALASEDLAPVGALPIEALCARVVDRLQREGTLGRFTAVAAQPGLPRALARTFVELRMAGATSVPGHPELDAALAALVDELARARLADRAHVYALAAAVTEHALLGHHVLMLDVPVRAAAERSLVAAIAARSRSLLALVPLGDDRTLRQLREVLGIEHELAVQRDGGALERVQRNLFAPTGERAAIDDSLAIFSAPGESRECVELARRVVREAERGVPFDRMAVLLRAPAQYRVHLEEALGRAGVPAYFEHGTVLPDPTGRAFVALLACAGEDLSARRFAEYLSLGEVPGATPPPARPRGERWVPPDEELLPRALAAEPPADDDDVAEPAHAVAPWRWERLLVEAAVIGSRERWTRRLDGLDAQLRLRLVDSDDTASTERMLADLAHLRAFALPLLDDLAALPAAAPWGTWLDGLAALATRALRRPDRVLAVLDTLAPMTEVGPVGLREVQLVLAPRLTELVVPASGSRYGRLLVAPIEAARGRELDVVFVPGLAERMFPQKLVEDPLLLDADRAKLPLALETRADRLIEERLALRLAVGAARRRLVLSYPRIDLEQERPRVPSFYGLEVVEAAEGTLPGFDELGQRADVTGAARIGWPAPANPLDAIDEAEHDLALLDRLVHAPAAATGAARYLLGANPHLARALRARGRRWEVRAWKPADGFIVSTPEGRAALDAHAPSVRSFSPTALEQLATCPLRFALRTIVKLEPREVPEPIQALGALERGSLVHEVQFELLGELRDASELPVRPAGLDAARDRLDATLDRVAARYRDELAPAIERVWADGIASIRADLREWLRRMADDLEWTPKRFELAFGLAQRSGRDPASVDEPVALDIGLALRGSIDLVEERAADAALRATDHKTGKARVERGSVIAGGSSLQPVLYALVLERLFGGKTIAGGRLDYCTTRGEFSDVIVPLDADARAAAQLLADTLAHHVSTGFFPAAPTKGACTYCDYRPVCGPYEEQRVRKKDRERLIPLARLRETR